MYVLIGIKIVSVSESLCYFLRKGMVISKTIQKIVELILIFKDFGRKYSLSPPNLLNPKSLSPPFIGGGEARCIIISDCMVYILRFNVIFYHLKHIMFLEVIIMQVNFIICNYSYSHSVDMHFRINLC